MTVCLSVLFVGSIRGKQIERNLPLQGLPWYQALSLSLRNHLDEDVIDQEFWSIRPDTMDLHRLQIADIASERLAMDENEVIAYCVEIRPAGWLSPFWKGRYWFSQIDRSFLRYEGDSGPPGSPQTIIKALD